MKIRLVLWVLVTIVLAGCSQGAFDEFLEQEQQQDLLSADKSHEKVASRSGQRESEALQLFMDNYIAIEEYYYKVLVSKDEAMKLGITGEE